MKVFTASLGTVSGAAMLGLLLAMFFLSQQAELAGGWGRNQAALATFAACRDGTSVASSRLEPYPWLKASLARCRGDDRQAQIAWLVALISSDQRLSVIQAARPEDALLARLAAERYPHNASAQFWLADNLVASGNTLGAIQIYEIGLQIQPTNGLNWRKLGDLYNKQGDWQTAVEAYDQACKYVDRGKIGCPRAGKIYMDHGIYDLAEQRYRTSTRQLPYWSSAKRGLVEALLAQGKTDNALPLLETLASDGDEDARLLLNELHIQKAP